MNRITFTSVQDEKDLRLLKKFLLKQPQFYPNHKDWIDGKCVPGIENGFYNNIIALVEGIIVGETVYRFLENNEIEIKNFRIDPDYRNRDIGHFLLKQIEADYKDKKLILDVTTINFSGVEFFIRNGFKIVDAKELYKNGQLEYLMEKV